MTTVTATCSDCLMTQQIELNPRRTEIRCEYCGHSVPMFQKKEMADITASLRAERNRNLIAFAIFLAAAAFFGVYVFFTLLGEPPVVVATAPGTEGGEKQYRLIRRDDEKAEKQLAVEHLETGEQLSLTYQTEFESRIRDLREKSKLAPEDAASYLSDAAAARLVAGELAPAGETARIAFADGNMHTHETMRPVNIRAAEVKDSLAWLFYVSILAFLAAVVFGAIASQDKLVSEF